MNTNLRLLKAVDFVVDVDIVDVLVVAGKSLHAPQTISQNETESHNTFLTISL